MIHYYQITKPGIIAGNLLTMIAGFWLASKEGMNLSLLAATTFGLSLTIASASVFNNYLDRDRDRKMERTRQRPLATQLIPPNKALLFGGVAGLLGIGFLVAYTNLLTASAALMGLLIYVLLYTPAKARTIYGTAIGSIAGAIPPIVGYTAVVNQLDEATFFLFTTLILWQMAHFFSIALLHSEDYAKAGIPTFPLQKGIFQTKIRMGIYILGFIIAASMLTYLHHTGYVYLLLISLCGFVWLFIWCKGFSTLDERLWGGRMLLTSLFVITTFSLAIPLDRW